MSIGRRLTVCFLLIVVSMIAGGALVFWQFRQMVVPSRRLSNANQTSLALARLHLDVDTFRENVTALESGHDTEKFSTEAAGLRQTFLRNVEDAQQALSKAPEIAREDPTIPAALETLKVTLPSQLDSAVQLAATGDWNAVRLRLGHQIQDLINLSSSLVEKVDRQAQQQRTKAIEDAETARQGLFLVLLIAGLLTLILAAALGWYATQSITVPLSELASGAQAFARGDLSHQVSLYGNDELAVVGRAFNHAARQLQELYEELREQASLLSLTHDAIYVRDMNGVIRYWNRGAEELYGWPTEQVVGKVSQELLKAVPPLPFEQIETELLRTGHWEGELVKTKKDGTQLVVASRWSLKRGERGEPVATLVTSNDISDRKRAEEALRRLNRELRAISNCNQSLLRATDEQSLLEEICRIVCEEAGYRAAWVAYAEHDEAKSVRPAAWTGTEQRYLASLGITWADTEHGCGPTGTAIRSGKTCCIQDFATDPRLALWRESALQHDFRSAIALPLKDEHADAFGSLTIYSAQPNAFTSEEIRLLEELAGDLAFGIVTLHSRAARERAEQEVALLSFALDNVREAAFLIDDTGHFHYVNEAGCRILGYTYVELLRMGVPDIDVEFPAGRWSDHWRDLQEQRSLSLESRHRTRDGRTFPVEISANYFEYGGRAYNLALVRDITERKQTEQERRESAERFRAIADYTYDWENWIGVDGKLLWVNPAVERMTGYSVSECIVMADFPIPIVAEADREAFAREIREAVQGSSRNDFEFRVRHKDGDLVWVAASWQPIYDSRGARLGHRSSMRDITERKKAEDAVRRSETYLAESQRLSHTGSFGFDVASDKYVYVSDECLRIFELDAQENLPTRAAVSRLIHPEDWDRVNEDFEKLLREKVDTPSEFRIVLPSGAVKHLHVIRHPVVNDGGEVVTILGTAIDITERKRAEEEVRNTAAQWQATFDAVQDYVLLLDQDFRILRANRAASEFLKLPVSKIVGEHCHDLVHGTSTPPAECPLAKMRQSRRHEEAEVPAGKEGPWFAVSVDPVFGPGGELTEVVHVARDITERKRAEEALRRTTAYLAESQRLTHTGTFVSDQTTRPLYWSEELFRTFGFDPRDGLPSREQPLERVHPEDLDKFRQAWDRAINGKVDSDVEYRIVLPDGTVKHLYGLGHPVLNPDGEVVEIVGSTVDITERKRAEQERERLRQLEADLAHINRVSVLGELAASIAHEVNQPISGVVSNASACLRWLGRDVPELEEAREAVRRIVRDGKRAGEVIARIRTLTRKAETPREKLDLNETTREVLALVGDEAKRKSVIVRTQFADDLSPVSGDRVQLQQVLLNLVINGMEAMSDIGERARELVITTRNTDTDQVQVTVEDSGIGLDPNTISKIFDPFYTTKAGGMGMGLSVSRSIVGSHGGRLWAAAKDGPGTVFHITLPKYHKEESDATVAAV